ncbi:MAG: ATP-binding protein [Magnetococcus sp. WYHC-3]
MLNLKLRQEFLGKRLKGTAIELSNDSHTGATEIPAQQFLEITYPIHDLLKGIEAIGPNQGRPVVVIGERGLGKSHLMAALYHAVNDPVSTKIWLDSWAKKVGNPKIGKIPLREKMFVIGESLHRQRYKFLWDLLFDCHPHGSYIKGKWEGMGAAKTDIPSDKLMLELLQHTPTILLLDEFQTWYDGLTNTKQYPWKNWAFNFIQILSEIAKERPDLLVLVISVRNGGSDAYQQVHRVNPVPIDFLAGGNPELVQQDRRRMLLHRLFENRLQITKESIEKLVSVHVAEYLRLLDIPSSDHERKQREFLVSWPFAPHLLRLLEEQVLIATDAQETRDMIRILASLYKSRGDASPVLTAADFRLDDDASGIGALLDSVSNTHHRTLRAKAQQNVISVTEAVPNHGKLVPHLQEIVGALWLRSIAVGNLAGAEPATLQADITGSKAIDDNAFQVELATVIENSFNIHQDGSRMLFREEENPQAKLMACARNDKLFSDRSDHAQLAKEVRYVIGGTEEIAKTYRVIILSKSWMATPWATLDESEQPERWDDRLPILVLPEEPDNLNQRLGRWLKDHLQKRRNTVRFLLPRAGYPNAFQDRDLLILARAVMKAQEWSGQRHEYKKLCTRYQGELRDILKKRFDRFAILHRWNFADPNQCLFSVENLKKQGAQIPEGIEEALVNDLFVPEDFEDLVLKATADNASVGKLLRELQEPRPIGQDCIPWLGETAMKERILRLCARGKIAINLRGLEFLQTQPGEDEDAAWRRLRPKLSYTGRQLDEVFLMEPSAVPTTGGTTPPAPQPPAGGGSGGLFGGETMPVPPPFGGDAANGGGMPSTGGSIFGGGSAGDGRRPRIPLSNPPTSPLNLIGKLEGWGIGPATQVAEVSIKVAAASGAQLKELLKKLPDGMTFEISLEKEDH